MTEALQLSLERGDLVLGARVRPTSFVINVSDVESQLYHLIWSGQTDVSWRQRYESCRGLFHYFNW